MSADTPILSKIPKTAGPRLKLLQKLLESWGVTVTPNKKSQAAEAKKRLGKLPSSIQEYFESESLLTREKGSGFFYVLCCTNGTGFQLFLAVCGSLIVQVLCPFVVSGVVVPPGS